MAVVGWFGLPGYNEFFCSFGTLFVKDGGLEFFIADSLTYFWFFVTLKKFSIPKGIKRQYNLCSP